MKKILAQVFCLCVFVYFFSFIVSPAQAACELSASPSVIRTGSTAQLSINLTNTTGASVRWMRVWIDDEAVIRLNSVSSVGWVWADAVLTGGEIADGSSATINLSVTAENANGTTRVKIETSDDPNGNTTGACGEGAIIEASDAVSANPVISNVSLAVSSTSATVSWDTDLATTGSIQYGTTSGYGSETGSGSYTTAHSLTITGLTPLTTYHYRLISAEQSGGSVATEDLTFITGAVNTVTTTSTITNTVTTTKNVESTITKVITDTTPPVIKITPLEQQTFSTAPLITGTTTDDRGISKVEYQIDGAGWSSASLNSEVGEKKSDWEFVPSLSLDGTYEINIRGVDVFGNTSAPKTLTFVIDQLPPTVGGGVVQYHGMRLVPQQGHITLWAEEMFEVIIHELGGAEEIQLTIGEKNWNLTKIKGTSLWKTEVQLPQGNWKSTVTARDGARKITSRPWLSWTAVPKAQVQRNAVSIPAELTLFWKEPTTGRFEPWHASEYGQNATFSTENTGFGWVVPPGEYYFSAKLPEEKIVSSIFKTEKVSLLGGNWEVGDPSWWSRFFARKVSLSNPFPNTFNQTDIPSFQKEDLEALVDPRWIGKKKIVVALSPSLPGSYEGLVQAQSWAQKEEADIVLLGEQVSPEQLQAWLTDNNTLSQTTDYEGKWLIPGNITVLPKAYLFDSYGKIVSIREGDLQ